MEYEVYFECYAYFFSYALIQNKILVICVSICGQQEYTGQTPINRELLILSAVQLCLLSPAFLMRWHFTPEYIDSWTRDTLVNN